MTGPALMLRCGAAEESKAQMCWNQQTTSKDRGDNVWVVAAVEQTVSSGGGARMRRLPKAWLECTALTLSSSGYLQILWMGATK